jgi:hypothetical protein
MPRLIMAAVTFIRTANVPANAFMRVPVANTLDEFPGDLAVEHALEAVTGGTPQTRQYRHAMIVILCSFRPIRPPQALHAVSQYSDLDLSSALGKMLGEVQKTLATERLDPALLLLQTSPGVLLATKRIWTGGKTPVGATTYELSWKFTQQRFLMQPVGGFADTLNVTFQGFNIAVTKFSTVQATVGQITGDVVLGSIGLTTQLSGCSIFYSVNAGNLVVAHVWPDDTATVKANLPAALAAQNALPVGVILGLRLAHQGGLSNALAGGTLGLLSMVNNPAHTGLRQVGPHNVRMHGYLDTLGHAYFVAVKIGASWELYSQQNDANTPSTGVGSHQRIYP